MDYTKLIDLYLEGELNSIEKELLFSELSKNQELREYFEEQIRFNQLFQRDSQSITVPSDVTNNVFAALNFKIPNADAVPKVGIAYKYFSALRGFFAKYVPYFASSVIGGLVAFALLWLLLPLWKPAPIESTRSNLAVETGIPVGAANEVPKVSAGREVITERVNYEKIIREALEKLLANYISNVERNVANTEQSTAKQELAFVQESKLKESAPTAFQLTKDEHSLLAEKPFAVKPNEFPIDYPKANNSLVEKFRNVTFGFRGYITNSNPDVKINLAEKGILTNLGLSVGYLVAKNTNIGFEFGQEKFAQEYSLSRFGETTYYKQNPLLWWYGIYFHQTIANLFKFEDLKPMTRIFLGGTPVGPLVRGAIGLQYTPADRVSMYLGWEGTYLGYKVQDKMYQTKKSGITYGVSIKY
jgi:hypothetical protein